MGGMNEYEMKSCHSFQGTGEITSEECVHFGIYCNVGYTYFEGISNEIHFIDSWMMGLSYKARLSKLG